MKYSPSTVFSVSNTTIYLSGAHPSAAPKEHLGSLDILRGFAAISVMLYHFSGGLPTLGQQDGGGTLAKFFSPTLKLLFSWGHLGVDVFFVISGFVIPYSLWNSGYTIRKFFPYILKRILRILPPAYVAIGLTLLQWLIVDYFLHYNHERLSALSTERLLGNLFFIYKFADIRWINGVFWTLSIEFQFYFFIGLLFNIFFKRRGIGWFTALFVSIGLFPLLYQPINGTFFSYSPLFATGGIALLYYKKKLTATSYWLLTALFFGLSCLLLSIESGLFGLGTSLIIIFTHVQHPIFAFFGKISFSLYLIHILVGSTTEFILAKLFPPHTELQHVLGIILISIISCIIAYGYYLAVEKPTLRLVKIVS